MDRTKPAIMIVTARFLIPAHYEPFIDALHDHGFSYVSCPRRMTSSDVRMPNATISDDVRQLRSAIDHLSGLGTPIIILAHDSGGLVANEAVRPVDILDRSANAASSRGGVVRVVYLSAMLMQPGRSFVDTIQLCHSKPQLELEPQSDGCTFPRNAKEALFHGLSNDVADSMTSMVVSSPGAVGTSNATNAAWNYTPSTYVFCSQHGAIPHGLQQMMVQEARDGAGMLNYHEEHLDDGCAAFLTHATDLVQILLRASLMERDRFLLGDDDDDIPIMGPLVTMDL